MMKYMGVIMEIAMMNRLLFKTNFVFKKKYMKTKFEMGCLRDR